MTYLCGKKERICITEIYYPSLKTNVFAIKPS